MAFSFFYFKDGNSLCSRQQFTQSFVIEHSRMLAQDFGTVVSSCIISVRHWPIVFEGRNVPRDKLTVDRPTLGMLKK